VKPTVSSLVRKRLLHGALLVAVFSRPLGAQCPDGSPLPCGHYARPLPRSTIAVLYLETRQGDTALAYLADGLTESLIDRLSQAGLSVASRYQVRRYRNQPTADPATLGRDLGVSNLLTGTVRGIGSHLQVSIEMIGAASAARLWGQQFEGSVQDLLRIERDIATTVADSIVRRLQPAQRRALASSPSTNPAAYELYLRGRYDLAQSTGPTIRRALEELEEASRLDPRSARLKAEVGVAYAHLFARMGATLPGVSPDSMLGRAFAAADAALRLDSASGAAWHARAAALWVRLEYDPGRDMTPAARAAERSIALDSLNPEAWHTYGLILMDVGEDDAAAAAFRRCLALEPSSATSLERLARLSLYRHQFADALRLLDSATVVEPGFDQPAIQYRRALALIRLGHADSARAALARGADVFAEAPLLILVAEGDSVAARTGVGRLRQPSWPAVEVLAALGERDSAVTMLQAMVQPTIGYSRLLRLPEMDPLRSDPRFQRLYSATLPLVPVR
jgi:TolB-like protein